MPEKPVAQYTPEDHFESLANLVRIYQEQGTPYIYAKTLVRAVSDLPELLRLRYYATFCAYYDLGAAFTTLEQNEFPPPLSWMEANWDYLRPLKKDRRTVNTPPKMHSCLESIKRWEEGLAPRLRRYAAGWQTQAQAHQKIMDNAQEVHHFGRYISIRFAETVRRGLDLGAESDNVFARGGSFIRSSVNMFYPNATLKPDTPRNVALTEELAKNLIQRLEQKGLTVSPADLSATLCEYRQHCKGWFYPAKNIDEDLRGINRAQEFGTDVSRLLQARAEFIAPCYLGEIQGWDEVRKPIHKVFRDTGHLFDDFREKYFPR